MRRDLQVASSASPTSNRSFGSDRATVARLSDFDDGLQGHHSHKITAGRHDLELATIYVPVADYRLNNHFLCGGFGSTPSGSVVRKLDTLDIKLQFVTLANVKEISLHSLQRHSLWKVPIQPPDGIANSLTDGCSVSSACKVMTVSAIGKKGATQRSQEPGYDRCLVRIERDVRSTTNAGSQPAEPPVDEMARVTSSCRVDRTFGMSYPSANTEEIWGPAHV